MHKESQRTAEENLKDVKSEKQEAAARRGKIFIRVLGLKPDEWKGSAEWTIKKTFV